MRRTANTKTRLDLGLVLPGLPHERDACVGRLLLLLQAKGLDRAHVITDQTGTQLCIHLQAGSLAVTDVRRLATAAGAALGARYAHASLRIGGMDCSTCANVIEHALARVDGVLEAEVSYAAERLRLELDRQQTSLRAVTARLETLGYRVVPEFGASDWWVDHRELAFSLSAGALLLAGWSAATAVAPPALTLTLYGLAYALGGYFTLRDAFQSLRARRFDIDILMIVAAAGAAALGAWAEGALLLFLFSLGHALEHLAMERARRAIEGLAELVPKTALVVRDGREVEVPVGDLLRGDRVVVKPGQRMPADGTVASGNSAVDQASVTGESAPVEKGPGALVFAGTINGEGALIVDVGKLAEQSTLARMVELVAEAQTQKSPTELLTARFERIFVPTVLAGVVLLLVVPTAFGMPFAESFYRAMAMLVAASPCALAIGTPAAVLSAIARAARAGVLIKGGGHLENLARISAIAFDKTGTLTEGRPRLTDVVSFAGADDELLALAAAVESRSDHPLARAVATAARERGLRWDEVTEVESVAGKGIRATYGDRRVEIGNLKLFADDGADADVVAQVQRLEDAGRTTMVVRIDGRYAGIIGLMDTPRLGVREVLLQLRGLGIRQMTLLTGDNLRVAQAVARDVGLTDVRASLLPADKVTVIAEIVTAHGAAAMVGDGVNDAPALARATVGIAMGGAGSDVALETADVALMGDDLAKLPFAIALSRAARATIRQNLALALTVVALLLPATLFGWAGIGTAVLLHEGSTLLVVLNALRLLGFRDRATHRSPTTE